MYSILCMGMIDAYTESIKKHLLLLYTLPH